MDMPTTRRELVTVKEAAARLGLSESDVRRRIKAGTLPAEQFDRPQGTYYRVIFETPVDASPSADQPSATSIHPSDTSQDVPATRPDSSTGVEALVVLVTRLTETVERQAQTIADLREERGKLQAHAEHASARASLLSAELDALKAAQSPPDAPGAAAGPAPTTDAPAPWWRGWWPWLLVAPALAAFVGLLAWPQ